MENVQFYESGLLCPHCAWVSGKKKIVEKLRMKPWETYQPYWKGFGVSVFDVHKKFGKTFNCINGEYQEDSEIYHNPMNLGQLLRGATMFIEYLNEKKGVKNARLLINSHANPRKYGGNGKEHPHALITVEDPGFFPESKLEPPDRPLEDDLFLDLDRKECSELIREGENTINYIAEKVKKRLEQPFNPETDSFYIFLKYRCENGCGFMSGKIAV